MNRAEKQLEVDFLNGCLTRAQIALCADYRGLTVSEVTKLRKELRISGSGARVVKNTLAKLSAKKAFKDAPEADKFLGLLDGPSFVVWSNEDPVSPAKVITDFAKDHEKLKVKGAWAFGGFLDTSGVQALAKMPGRKELLTKLLCLINAPATQLVNVMTAPARQIVQVVDAQRRKLEGS